MSTLKNLVVLAFLLSLAGCGSGSSGGGFASLADPEYKQAVRKYLRENTNSGKWEEIEWSEYTKEKSGFQQVRLKYRLLTPAPFLAEQYFSIWEDGKISTREAGWGRFSTDAERIEGLTENILGSEANIQRATDEEGRKMFTEERDRLREKLRQLKAANNISS